MRIGGVLFGLACPAMNGLVQLDKILGPLNAELKDAIGVERFPSCTCSRSSRRHNFAYGRSLAADTLSLSLATLGQLSFQPFHNRRLCGRLTCP